MKKKLMQLFALVFATAMTFGACTSDSKSGSKEGVGSEKRLAGTQTVGDNVVNVWEGKEVLKGYDSVTFEETENLCADNEGQGWVILEEPLKGGLPSLGYEGTFPEVKSISLSTGWSCFEEEPGVFDWTVMDETIAYWAEQGKTINLRLCTDGLELNQGVVNGAPAWLYEEPYNVPKVVVAGDIFADLSSKTYQTELRRFMTEFAGHYNSPDYPYRDAIEVVEVRGYGMVGEWHSGWNTYSSVEERTQALRDTIDIWREAWGDKLLVISCTYEFLNQMPDVLNAKTYDDFMYWMGYDHVLQLENMTFRRDGIAFALREWDKRMAIDYFYQNTGLPLLGEMGGGYHTFTDNSAYALFEAVNEAFYRWRINYQSAIGWVAQDFNNVIENDREIVEHFVRMQGYRLVPNRVQYSNTVKAGDKFYMNTLWSNRAVGRCWTDHDVSVYFENASGETVYVGTDARFAPVSINNGEPHFFNLSYDLPATLSEGEYTVKFAISDAQGNPTVEMPIAGNDGTNKYYLGKVTVGGTAATPVHETDTLDGAKVGYTLVGQGKLTDRMVNVDGTKALVGGGSGLFAKGQKLKNGKTYYVSFDYKTNKPREEITITDTSRYLVGAYDEEGEIFGDSYKWLDVSNDVSHRSVTITVPDDGVDYVLAFGTENDAAQIAIDNICVQEANVVESTFRVNPDYTVKKGEGEYEITSNYIKSWSDGVQLKERLKAHTTYMLTFDAKTIQEISGGAFFYVNMQDPNVNMMDKKPAIESFSLNHIGSWYVPEDYGYMKYSFVFNTENYADGWQINFGVYARGGYSLKNITLTCLGTDASYAADPQEIPHNVIPPKNIDVDAKVVYENFEAGVFNGGCMFPGYHNSGIIRRDRYTISGDYSCYILNDNPELPAYEFNVFCYTNVSDIIFSPDTVYKIKFKFMIIDDVLESDPASRFACYARRNGDYTCDTSIFEWRGYKDGYEEGKVYSVECEFKTNATEGDYMVCWDVMRFGGIAIDDVVFEKVDATAPASGVTVTEGHAYTITQDVLYTR